MNATTAWALLTAVVLFVIFVVLKSRLSLGRDPDTAEARKQLIKAKQRVRAAKGDPDARAAALREASQIALDDLQRPGLAASFARRADRADPSSSEGLKLLARAMRQSERYRALERLLWRRLAEVELGTSRSGDLFDQLFELYEGPLRRSAQAKVLRTLIEAHREPV